MKVEITKAQLIAIGGMADTLSAMCGAYDQDFNNEIKRQVKLTDRFFKKNGFKRLYK